MEETGGLLQYEEWNQFSLMWKRRGMWGINKSEITLSVFSSNRKRATFGKVLLFQKLWPSWLSLGWKELGILYLLAIICVCITHITCGACNWKIHYFKKDVSAISVWWYIVDSLHLLAINKFKFYSIHKLICISCEVSTITTFYQKLVGLHKAKRHHIITLLQVSHWNMQYIYNLNARNYFKDMLKL